MTEFVPKRKKLLTRPVLKYVVDIANNVKIEEKMHIGKEMKAKEGEKMKEPATLFNVIDLNTGEPAQLICNAVVKSVLNESYPNDSYVGLCFSITKKARTPGKQYDPFMIEEIDDPTVEVKSEAKDEAAPQHNQSAKRR